MTISSIASSLQGAYADRLGQSLNVTTRTGTNATLPPADPSLPAGKAKVSSPSDDDKSTDPTDLLIKQLEDQLRQITQQMARLRASKIPEQQKTEQLQALNQEAGEIMSRIASLQEQKLQAARGITA